MDSFEMENLWNYESEFDNFHILNTLASTVMYQPLIEFDQIKPTTAVENVNFMSVFAGGKECKKSLRLLSTEPLQSAQPKEEAQDTIYFCMFSKNEHTNQKRYWLLPYQKERQCLGKLQLALDMPNQAIVVNQKLLVAVQRKCITLYRIHNQSLIIKDFDSIGIGKSMIVVELQHVKYKGKDYLLIFGNEKEDLKSCFKCIVYELSNQKLNFVKKATLFEREHFKPIILFDHYPGKEFVDEMFCLVVGGFSDYEQQNYNFGALQIHLHLLIEEWIQYPTSVTREILFSAKHTITSGKAVKIATDISRDEFWLVFCTDYQTISKMDLVFGFHDDAFLIQKIELDTKTLKIRDQTNGEIEPIYYCENTLYLNRVPQTYVESKNQIPYRLYWCTRKMDRVCSRPLSQILRLFWHN